MGGKLWTDEEHAFVAANYETMTNRAIAAKIGRSPKAVQTYITLNVLRRKIRVRERCQHEHPPGTLEAIVAACGRIPASEIAKKYGMSTGAVHAIWTRARRRGALPPLNRFNRHPAPAAVDESRSHIVEKVMIDRGWLGTTADPKRVAISLPRVRFLELAE